MQQYSFDLSFKDDEPDNEFIVSSSNYHAYELITSWPNWSTHAAIIYGDKGSGKSTLARMWQKIASAKLIYPSDITSIIELTSPISFTNFVIEDIENIYNEENVFHLFNKVKEQRGFILFTSKFSPQNLNLKLPDLKSRLCSVVCAHIESPDENLVQQLLFKCFMDKQLKVDLDIIKYISLRIERSSEEIKNIVDQIDAAALSDKKNITIPFIRKIL